MKHTTTTIFASVRLGRHTSKFPLPAGTRWLVQGEMFSAARLPEGDLLFFDISKDCLLVRWFRDFDEMANDMEMPTDDKAFFRGVAHALGIKKVLLPLKNGKRVKVDVDVRYGDDEPVA